MDHAACIQELDRLEAFFEQVRVPFLDLQLNECETLYNFRQVVADDLLLARQNLGNHWCLGALLRLQQVERAILKHAQW